MDLLDRDRAFYENSGGGVTLTGGEPLAQPEFAADLLATCQRAGLHTALETSGYAEWDVVEDVVQHVDLLYYDLKHADADAHRAGTGYSNEEILRNFTRLGEEFPGKLVVRIPYVPGFNDDLAVLAQLFERARRAPSVARVEVLPYHRLGLTKYAALGRTCSVANLQPVDKGSLEPLRELGRQHGVAVEIDGR